MRSYHIFRWRGPNCRPKSGCQRLPFPALVGELWQKRDFEEFLLRAEAAQRLQDCGGICSGRVAYDSGGVDFSPRIQCAAMGDENYYSHPCDWIPDCAGVFLSVRDYAGRNQTRIRDRAEQIDQATHRAKDCCRNDRAWCRCGRSVRVSTRALEINGHASTERGGYSGP